jgi:uncharacterized phage infection (PIP) family protein YhgE
MLESLLTTLDQFTPEILVIMTGLLVITSTLFLWLWFANRRTYQLLKHQIPASVVKTYLDSIIQNSTSLKSSLFRGGGEDLSAAIPSVFPTINLGGGENVAVASAAGANDSVLREQLAQRQAEIASLQSQLASANGAKKDLEKSLTDAHARIKELEALLAKGSSDSGLAAEMQKISKERDELREKLKEYEIIEDDLANLKRLQQENQQLRRALEAQGGNAEAVTDAVPHAPPSQASAPQPEPDPLPSGSDIFEELPTPVAEEEASATAELEQFLGSEEPAPEPAPEPEPESDPEPEPAAAVAAALAAATEAPPEAKPTAPEKTPEDLLSEFEKMLG